MRHTLRSALLTLLAVLTAAAPAIAQTSRNLVKRANMDEYTVTSSAGSRYSSVWGYVHGDGREYAAIGTMTGTAIYNVTNPDSPINVGFIPGPGLPGGLWRNIKSYRNYIYISTEATGAGEGIQVVSMVNPDSPVLVNTYATGFTHTHTMHMDTTRAMLICNGTRNAAGLATGARILSLANPAAPVELGWFPGGSIPASSASYAHDSFQRGNHLYLASINAGFVRVLDTTNPAAPTEITSWTYPGAFTHNLWTTSDEQILYLTDEVNGEPVKVFDISNLFAPAWIYSYTANSAAICHNVRTHGSELYAAHYTEGTRILDISDPRHPAEFAHYDSYPGASGGYFGVWEVYPYFPSGNIIASDMQTGLYVFTPSRNYGIIRARVVHGATQAPLENIRVRVVTQGDSLLTPADGIVQFAPSSGPHTVTASLFGWTTASANVNVTTGSRDTVTLAMTPKPVGAYAGSVVNAANLVGLDEAEVRLAYTPLKTQTAGGGAFNLSPVPVDLYRVEASRPGFMPVAFNREMGPAFPDPQTIKMKAAPIYYDMETTAGWTAGAAGDDATTGIWVRVEPLGTGEPQQTPNRARRAGDFAADDLPGRVADANLVADVRASRAARRSELLANPPADAKEAEERMTTLYSALSAVPGDVQPEFDRTPAPGEMCWVTGQGTNPASIGEADVDNGRTSLTSAALAVAGMADARLTWWQWFYSTGDGDDWLAVRISNNNGATWADVDTLRGPTTVGGWNERSIRVADYVTPTNQVLVRFVAADLGSGSVVEAAIDDLIAWDAALATTVDIGPRAPATGLRFASPWPNPSTGAVQLSLELPEAGHLEVGVYDVTGRLVRTLHDGAAEAGALSLGWSGEDARGRVASAGLYFARAIANGKQAQTRFVKVD